MYSRTFGRVCVHFFDFVCVYVFVCLMVFFGLFICDCDVREPGVGASVIHHHPSRASVDDVDDDG